MHASALRSALLVAVLVLGVAGTNTPAVADDDTPTAAEDRLLALVNRDRAAAGLVPVRLDARLREVARERSTDMAVNGYFSHDQPNGLDVFDLIDARAISWYGAGEILAWNTYPTLTESATGADAGWLASSSHRGVVLSSDYNYVGFGLAVAPDGRRIWTGVFIKGPDRTRPVARAAGLSRPSTDQVRFAWRGSDVRLQVLTAGVRDYQVQRRLVGGSWAWVTHSTTTTARTTTVSRGRRYEYRVRSRDRAGNVSSWTLPLSIST